MLNVPFWQHPHTLSRSLSHTQSHVFPLSLCLFSSFRHHQQLFWRVQGGNNWWCVHDSRWYYREYPVHVNTPSCTHFENAKHTCWECIFLPRIVVCQERKAPCVSKNDIFMILIAVFIFNFRAAIMRQQPPTWHLQCMQVLCACVYTRESWCARSSLMWACVFLLLAPWIPRKSTSGARGCFQHLRTRFSAHGFVIDGLFSCWRAFTHVFWSVQVCMHDRVSPTALPETMKPILWTISSDFTTYAWHFFVWRCQDGEFSQPPSAYRDPCWCVHLCDRLVGVLWCAIVREIDSSETDLSMCACACACCWLILFPIVCGLLSHGSAPHIYTCVSLYLCVLHMSVYVLLVCIYICTHNMRTHTYRHAHRSCDDGCGGHQATALLLLWRHCKHS